jgi:lipopolysaccharide cholinephosphotransferase
VKYTDDQLHKLQDTELEILQEIIRVCNANNITYFTVGGTTLGAIRHNGFIPWDDDIDIGMMRDDYEKFLSIAKTELAEGFSLTYYYTDPNSPTYYAKVRKDGTKFVEPYTKNIKMHHGIFVDIMPYDFAPEDKKERKKYYRRIYFWNQLYIAKTVCVASMIETKNQKVISVARHILHFVLAPVSKKYLYEKTDKALRRYNKKNTRCVSSRGLANFESEIDDLLPTTDHEFSGILVKIPRNADKLLRIQYGDYMKLPPLDKRYGHAPLLLKF